MSREQCPSCGSSTGLGEIHCFKCGYVQTQYRTTPGFFSDNVKNSQILALRDDIILAPKKFPPSALLWLYKSCIYDPVIISQKIAYCEDIHKVLIPAFNKLHDLMFYQLRSLDLEKDPNKYVSYGKMSSYTILYRDFPDDNLLIIVEDHLSAIRLRKYFNVCALSGTSINWDTCLQLIKNYSKIVFWLDPDLPGREAMYKLFNRLTYHSSKHAIKQMFTGQMVQEYDFKRVDFKAISEDPKTYLDHEIKNIIKNKVVEI